MKRLDDQVIFKTHRIPRSINFSLKASAILAELRLEDEIYLSCTKKRHYAGILCVSIYPKRGTSRRKRAIALSSLREGLPIEIVALITGLSIDEIQQLQQQLESFKHN